MYLLESWIDEDSGVMIDLSHDHRSSRSQNSKASSSEMVHKQPSSDREPVSQHSKLDDSLLDAL